MDLRINLSHAFAQLLHSLHPFAFRAQFHIQVTTRSQDLRGNPTVVLLLWGQSEGMSPVKWTPQVPSLQAVHVEEAGEAILGTRKTLILSLLPHATPSHHDCFLLTGAPSPRKSRERQAHSLPGTHTYHTIPTSSGRLRRAKTVGSPWSPLGSSSVQASLGQDLGPGSSRAGVWNPQIGLLQVAGTLHQSSLLPGKPNYPTASPKAAA